MHCQGLSQNGHRGTIKSFSGLKRKTKASLSAVVNTRFYFTHLFFFSTLANTSSGRARDKKKNSQFDHTTKNPQKPKCFSGSIHDQTFPQVVHTNKNLLSGTKNSKMLLRSNKADRETHEPTTRKKRGTNKQKISGKRRPSGIKALRLRLTCLEF